MYTLNDFDGIIIWRNQGYRTGYVLAIIDNEALVEYDMPNGTTSLLIIPREVADPDSISLKYKETKNVSYNSLPKKWAKAMEKIGSRWYGRPQGRHWSLGAVPQPY